MRREFGGGFGAKQCQHADDAAVAARDGAGQHAVGNLVFTGLQHHSVDQRCAAPHLGHRQQVPVRLGQQRGVQRRFFRGVNHGDAAFRNDQRGQPDFQVLGRTGDDVLKVGGALGLGILAATGERQQHLQIVILFGERAVKIQDLMARQQFAPQALERRLDQSVHECERALLALCRVAEAN